MEAQGFGKFLTAESSPCVTSRAAPCHRLASPCGLVVQVTDPASRSSASPMPRASRADSHSAVGPVEPRPRSSLWASQTAPALGRVAVSGVTTCVSVKSCFPDASRRGAGSVRPARTKMRAKTGENRDVGRKGAGEKHEMFARSAPLRLQRPRGPTRERHRAPGPEGRPRDGWPSLGRRGFAGPGNLAASLGSSVHQGPVSRLRLFLKMAPRTSRPLALP